LNGFVPISPHAAAHVLAHMREWDRREVMAMRWEEEPAAIAAELVARPGVGWIGWRGPEPVVLMGAVPLCPGVWSVYMVATDSFSHLRFSATRHARQVMMPVLLAAGAHRAECLSLDGHEDAQRWLESLGAHREGAPQVGRGKNGETYHLYAWTDRNVSAQRPSRR